MQSTSASDGTYNAQRHIRDRHRPEHRADPGAAARRGRDGAAARGGAAAGRRHPEAIDRGADVRDADVAGQALRQPVPVQLRRHQPAERAGAHPRRRQRHGLRRRPLRHPRLDGPGPAAGARADADRRHQRDPAAEPGGHRRRHRHAADAAGARTSSTRSTSPGVSTIRPISRTSSSRSTTRRRPHHAHQGHRPGRARGADLQPDLHL